MTEIYYRYEDVPVSYGISEYGLSLGHYITIQLLEIPVERRTERGAWLRNGKFVLDKAMKRYAYPTKEEARTSFLRRKENQVRILEVKLDNAKSALEQGKRIKVSDEVPDPPQPKFSMTDEDKDGE